MFIYIVFFFKQKTAYEMRISDWSSDVCSSDLPEQGIHAVYPHSRNLSLKVRVFVDFLVERFGPAPYWDDGLDLPGAPALAVKGGCAASGGYRPAVVCVIHRTLMIRLIDRFHDHRTEERSVGKESVSTVRSRWWEYI